MCETDEFNLDERILCSDDTCIGLVGPNGLCKECGAPYDGPLDAVASKQDVAANATAEETMSPPSPDSETPPSSSTIDLEMGDGDLDARIPCADDLCIGVVGPDGRCGTCGKIHDIQ